MDEVFIGGEGGERIGWQLGCLSGWAESVVFMEVEDCSRTLL